MADRPLPEGFIDTHCHLLPAVDDGCRDLGESLRCIEALIEAGFVGSICTPHVRGRHGKFLTPQIVAELCEDLQRQIDDAGLVYTVWPGGELRLDENLIDHIERNGVVTLAGSRCVLADFWSPDWPAYVDEVMQWLLDRGYQPILAHPERQAKIAQFDQHIDRLANSGVLFQGNANCVVGGQGTTAKAWIDKGLKADIYSLLALDLHNPAGLSDRLEGLSAIRGRFGDLTLKALIKDMPRQIVTAKDAP